MNATKRGWCQVCRRLITVKVDGTLRHHTNPNAPRDWSRFAARCEGSDNYPLEEQS
jgi:hypothetical protein